MRNKPDLEQLLEQALEMANSDKCYRLVVCYLKPALETTKEIEEVRRPS